MLSEMLYSRWIRDYMVRGASWKSSEIELIKKFYPDYNKEKLLQLLPNRTWRAISDKAQMLGIKINDKGTMEIFRYNKDNVKIGSIGEKLAKVLLEREGCKVYDFKMVYRIRDSKIEKLTQLKEFVRSVDLHTHKLHLPDFVAFKGNEVFVIEVKTGNSPLQPSQRKILLKSLDYGLTPIVVNVKAVKHFLSKGINE